MTLFAASRWKICSLSQPLQSTFQPSTTMLLAWSERKVRAVAGPTKEMLLPPEEPAMCPFSRSLTTTFSPVAVRKVTPGAAIEALLGPMVTLP